MFVCLFVYLSAVIIYQQVVTCVLPLLQDSHPRVRYSACNCIGQLSSDFPDKFQSSHHARVVPALVLVLQDSSQPRVQAHCAAALTLFCEDCPQEVLAPYLVPIVEILSSVMAAKLQVRISVQIIRFLCFMLGIGSPPEEDRTGECLDSFSRSGRVG